MSSIHWIPCRRRSSRRSPPFCGATVDVTTPGSRITGIEMAEPTKAELAAFEGGGRVGATGHRAVTGPRQQRHLPQRGVAQRRPDRVLRARAGRPAELHRRRIPPECDRGAGPPDFLASLARRGITDLDLVLVDTWGPLARRPTPPEFRDRAGWAGRTSGCATWPAATRAPTQISGLHCVIDLNSTMELLRIEDTGLPRTASATRPSVMAGVPARPDASAAVRCCRAA